MPGTILVKEILRRCSAQLMDDDPQFVRHPEQGMVDAYNDAQRAIHTYLPASCSRIDALRMAPGTLQSIESILPAHCKPSDGSTPAVNVVGSMLLDVMCNMGADGLTPGKTIRAVPDGRELLDAVNVNWQSKFDVEIRNFVFDPRTPRHFHIIPGAHPTAPVWARCSFIAEPIQVPNTGTPGSPVYHASGSSTLTISVHDEHANDLTNYVCARMLMKNAKASAGTGMSWSDYAALFMASINARSQQILGYNPNLKKLPFAPSPIGAGA